MRIRHFVMAAALLAGLYYFSPIRRPYGQGPLPWERGGEAARVTLAQSAVSD